MMYLVLTAMLALNVSKDILRVLAKLDLGMNATVSTVERGTATMYQAIQAQVSENPRAIPVNERAKEVQKQSEEVFAMIKTAKEEMITLTGGIDEEGRYKGADNRDIAENYLVNDKSIGGKGMAKEIKERLIAYRTFLESQTDGDETMKATIAETFTFDDEVVEGKKNVVGARHVCGTSVGGHHPVLDRPAVARAPNGGQDGRAPLRPNRRQHAEV